MVIGADLELLFADGPTVATCPTMAVPVVAADPDDSPSPGAGGRRARDGRPPRPSPEVPMNRTLPPAGAHRPPAAAGRRPGGPVPRRRARRARPSASPSSPPPRRRRGTPSSTWYCAAGSATGVASGEGAGPAEQVVVISNASDTACHRHRHALPRGRRRPRPSRSTVAAHSRSDGQGQRPGAGAVGRRPGRDHRRRGHRRPRPQRPDRPLRLRLRLVAERRVVLPGRHQPRRQSEM